VKDFLLAGYNPQLASCAGSSDFGGRNFVDFTRRVD